MPNNVTGKIDDKTLKLAIFYLINTTLDLLHNVILKLLCQIVGLSLLFLAEESPGSVKTQCQLIAGEGDFRDSATEIKPPYQGKGETAR